MKLLTGRWSCYKASFCCIIWHAVEFVNPIQVNMKFGWYLFVPFLALFYDCLKKASNSYRKWRYHPRGSKSEAAVDKSSLCCKRSILMSKLGFLNMKVSFLTSHVCPRTRCVNALSPSVSSIKGKLESLLKNFVKLNPPFLSVSLMHVVCSIASSVVSNSVKVVQVKIIRY